MAEKSEVLNKLDSYKEYAQKYDNDKKQQLTEDTPPDQAEIKKKIESMKEQRCSILVLEIHFLMFVCLFVCLLLFS